MAYREQLAGYVKFLRGTPAAWAQISPKDPDTLYFIAEPNAVKGSLYLGNKLISGGGGEGSAVTISDLEDVLIGANVPNNAVLVYNETSQVWEPVALATAITQVVGIMTGATAQDDGLAGMVPQPLAGDNVLFLRGDATWADPTVNVNQRIDDLLGNDTGSIRDIASSLIDQLVGNAPEALDTLEELAAWAEAHEDALDLTQVTADIANLNDALFGENPDESLADLTAVVQPDGVIKTLVNLENVIFGDNNTSGLQSDVEDLNIALAAANDRIDTLEDNVIEITDQLRWRDVIEES